MFEHELFGKTGRKSGGKQRGRAGKRRSTLLKTRFRSERLEDRAMLAGDTGNLPPGPPTTALPATHFGISAPHETQVGLPVPVGLIALDVNNHPVNNFTGIVHFSSTDGAAKLPMDYTFKADDHGRHIFFASFGTVGPETLTIATTGDKPLTISTDVLVDPQALATHFAVVLPPNTQAGQPTTALVLALDANNLPVLGYNGSATVTSSDPGAKLPASAIQFHEGHAKVEVVFATAGSQSITLTDSLDTTIVGTASTNVAAAAVATHFAIFLPPNVPTGVQAAGYLLALDVNNRPVKNYAGIADLTSSDTGATFAATSVTFKEGRATFQVTFANAGQQTVTATEEVVATTGLKALTATPITGTATVNVTVPAVATHFAVFLPRSITAGAEGYGYLIALDASNRPVKNYTGTVTLTSTDPGVVFDSSTVTFTEGRAKFEVTFATVGQQTVTATDNTDPNNPITGSVGTNVTTPLVATHFALLMRENVPAGQPVTVYVVALDANNRLVTNYQGKVTISSSDTGAGVILPTSAVQFENGRAKFQVTLVTVGKQSVTATDSTDPANPLTGTVSTNVFQPTTTVK